jgi:ribosomal protein L37E
MAFGYNSTINRKKKECKSCGKPSFIFSRGRCADCSRIEDTQKRMEKETEKVIRDEDLSGLVSDADTVFSQYIRLKYANQQGFLSCFTCGVVKHWTLQQNGHYIKRGHLFLRHDERNCRPQCVECNEYKGGNMGEFTKRLEKESYGITEILKEESALVYKVTRDELRGIISDYSKKVKELKSKLKK